MTPEGAMRGAEKKIIATLDTYLRKAVRGGSEPDPDPDDTP